MRGFIYKCVQVDVYLPLSPLLINTMRENLSDTRIFFESQIFFQGQITSSSARGRVRLRTQQPIEHGTLPNLTLLQYKKKSNTNH